MKLPEKLSMRETAHGHGAKGMAFYTYADGAIGVHMEARRASSRERFVESFWWAYMPGQTFPTYRALCEAALSVTEEQMEAERAMYPYVRSAEPVGERSYQNRCRLCPWGADHGSSRKPGVLIVHLAHNWQPSEDSYVELCEDHQHIVQDARALNEALDAEVAVRKARAAAKGLL